MSSLWNKFAFTTVLGISTFLGSAKAQNNASQDLPDSTMIPETHYVVKPYKEETTVIPPGAVLHGSFSSDSHAIWMDKANYALFCNDRRLQDIVTKMTRRLNEDNKRPARKKDDQTDTPAYEEIVATGFFSVYQQKSNNQIMVMSGYESSIPEKISSLSHALSENKHNLDAYQKQISDIERVNMFNDQFSLVDSKVNVEAGRAPRNRP